jgi:hypothetical protein
LAHADVSTYRSCNDPIFRLQFLARIGIQSDLADLVSLLSTPCLVSAFAVRDGAFTLEGTGILVRRCDLENVWLRFALLLVIRPAASTLARLWLDRDMGRTMMCKPTLHGPSALGLEIHNGATRLNITSRAAFEHLVNTKLRDVRCTLNLTAAEFAVVRRELSLQNLEYRQCALAMLRQHMAFCKCQQHARTVPYTLYDSRPLLPRRELRASPAAAAAPPPSLVLMWPLGSAPPCCVRADVTVVVFQLIAAFPVHRTIPVGLSLAGSHPPSAATLWANSPTMLDVPAQLRWLHLPVQAAPGNLTSAALHLHHLACT